MVNKGHPISSSAKFRQVPPSSAKFRQVPPRSVKFRDPRKHLWVMQIKLVPICLAYTHYTQNNYDDIIVNDHNVDLCNLFVIVDIFIYLFIEYI